MEAESKLIMTDKLVVGERSLIPIMRVSALQHKGMMWSQATPVAIVIVEEKKHYLKQISEKLTLEELEEKIPALRQSIRKERVLSLHRLGI